MSIIRNTVFMDLIRTKLFFIYNVLAQMIVLVISVVCDQSGILTDFNLE